MNPQTGLYLSWGVILVAAILGALGAFGSNYYGKKVDDHKQQMSVEPAVDFKIDSQKILTLENRGAVNIKDIRIFLTRYILDENLFKQKQLKIKDYSKIGGIVKNIPLLYAKAGHEKIDLTKLPLVTFYDDPGTEFGAPFLIFYCLRITFRKEITAQPYVYYKVTTAYKNFPSLIENLENAAVSGGDNLNFMLNIPDFLRRHQMKLYNDAAVLNP